MIDLVLDDLRREAGVSFYAGLKLLVPVPHPDRTVPLRFARAGQGQASLFGFISPGTPDDFRVEHHRRGAVVVEDDDPPGNADHVGRHAHAAVPVRFERVPQVLRNRQVHHRRRSGLPGKKDRVFHNGSDHDAPLTACRIWRCCPGIYGRGTRLRSDSFSH